MEQDIVKILKAKGFEVQHHIDMQVNLSVL